MKYDYLIVGAGLFGATFAYKAKRLAKKSLSLTRETTSLEMHIRRIFME